MTEDERRPLRPEDPRDVYRHMVLINGVMWTVGSLALMIWLLWKTF